MTPQQTQHDRAGLTARAWPSPDFTGYAGPNQPDPPGTPHPLHDPPPWHQKLTDFGERPSWSPDGRRIAFIEKNYGDVCEIDLETRALRHLTRDLGDSHSFLRVLFLPTGDYLLIGPTGFKDRDTSRRVESELWWMDARARRPPRPLGRRIFEGLGVSAVAPRITYAVSGRNDPSLGAPDVFECHVTELEYGRDGVARPGADRVIYRAESGSNLAPEPQDFRHRGGREDAEVIMAEYVRTRHAGREEGPTPPKCIVKGVELETGAVRTYVYEGGVHNECEGIFPDHEHICLECSVDTPPPHGQNIDLWKLKLDGSGRRVRLTRMVERFPWRATNSNVSPDGRWLAFMVNRQGDEAGYGRGLGLLDLAAWEASPAATAWDTAPVAPPAAD
ncbi:MAG: hypothetical protein M3442_04645 [Chloroflexota bacterium]|nr:hypothetical protein [Chloroflexota bacterium]